MRVLKTEEGTSGEITLNTATLNGGAIYATGYYDEKSGAYGHATVTVQGGEISGNTAGGSGGGIYATGSKGMKEESCAWVTVSGGSITDNTATEYGGGIYAYIYSLVTVSEGSITENEANSGGGVYTASHGSVILKGGSVENNTATKYGGGVCALNASSVLVDGGSVIGNTAQNGAGIYASGFYTNATNYGRATITVEDGEISGNIASAYGGGIYATGVANQQAYTCAAITVSGGSITDNQAQNGGGICSAEYSSVTLDGGSVNQNTATDNGGGVFVLRGGTLTVNEGHIFNNTAVAPKNATMKTTGKNADSDELHGAGGGICVVGEGPVKGVIYIANFKLTGEIDPKTNRMNVGIYGNTATFSGDEVFSNGKNTKLEIPLVSEMKLDGYELEIVGWFEDYNTGDTKYTNGLNMITQNGGTVTTDADGKTNALRYRNSTANDREVVKEQYVDGIARDADGKKIVLGTTDEGETVYKMLEDTQYVNLSNAYVALALGIPNAADDTVVVDYGLSVEIDLLANDMLLKSSNPETESMLGLSLPGGEYGVEANKEILYSKRLDEDGNKIDLIDFERYLTNVADSKISVLNCGTATWKIDDTTQKEKGVLIYTVNSMEMASKEVFYYAVPGEKFYYYGAVNVIPATSIYFEDNCGMVTYHESSRYETLAQWEQVTGEDSTAADSQAQDRPGASSLLDSLDANNIYGYDGSYINTKDYSNGSAYKVTVNRHKAQDKIANNGLCDYKDKATGKFCSMKLPAAHEYVNNGRNQCKTCLNTEDKHSGDIPEHECIDTRNYNEYCDICSQWIGTHTTSARATFTFTGTGFDIISLCNKNTGMVLVSVYKGTVTNWDNPDPTGENYVASYFVDTYYGYDYVDGKWQPNTDPNSNTSLYQVPVIKADLTKVEMSKWNSEKNDYDIWYEDYGYGTYSVEIYVSTGFLPWELSYATCDFYLDSIRIYNPAGIGEDLSDTVLDAYVKDGEGWPVYQELRNMFLTQNDLEKLKDMTDEEKKDEAELSGILFIDGMVTPTLSQYMSWGPNNEVYLKPGQSVAFTLNALNYVKSFNQASFDEELIASIHLGMRGINNLGQVRIEAGTGDDAVTLNTALSTTDMYYDVTGMMNKVVTITNPATIVNAEGKTVCNTTDIAISNFKVTHTEDPYQGEATESGVMSLSSMFTINRNDADIALDILTPDVLTDPVLKPKYPALSFEGMVCYNVFFTADQLGDLTADDLGLAVFDSYDPEGTVETAKDVILGATEVDGLYMVTTNGVHAKYLSDTQYFRTFVKLADGSYVYSKMVSYSALDYAKNTLAKSNDVKLKQLVVAMLNYGAEAQKFFGYKTDDLMNKDLTADQQALVAGFNAGALDAVDKADASKIGAFRSTGSFSKRYPAISFKGAFEINYFMAPANAVDGEMTLYCWSEDTYNSVTELTAENADKVATMTLENGLYTASSFEIAAKDLDETVYVAAVYESNGQTHCSGVLPYSIASYCQNPAANVADLANAAAIYGCTAKEFFGA